MTRFQQPALQSTIRAALFYFVAQRFLRLAAGEPYFNLGNLAAHQNQIDQAIAYFQQALKLDPNHAPAHNNLGRWLAAHGKWMKPCITFARRSASIPNLPPPRKA